MTALKKKRDLTARCRHLAKSTSKAHAPTSKYHAGNHLDRYPGGGFGKAEGEKTHRFMCMTPQGVYRPQRRN